MSSEKIDVKYVLDTSVFINRIDVPGVTVPEVKEELKNDDTELFFDTHRPGISVPDKSFIEKVKEEAEKTGDLPVLSETDINLLALAFGLEKENENPVILTDDYAVQNVASSLGIEFRPVDQRGIVQLFEWEWFCPGCGRVYDSLQEKCEVCGSKLKRRRID